MGKYRIEFKKSVYKELEKIPDKYSKRIYESIGRLADNPIPRDSVKLKNRKMEYRIQVGNYRAVYSVNKKIVTVLILKVAHRQSVYQQ